jgi:LytS/YehU family sensor histidine kinase
MSREMPVTVKYQTQGDFDSNIIAPLLLIPFVENAFKHGLRFDEPTEISIAISCFSNALELTVLNSIKPRAITQIEENASGIGLNNVRKRLALIYPDKHTISITNKNGKFNVHLQIQLN